ncbi:hypothetical protein H4R18_000654 [Coemansia javaensis]|uniref:Extracellular membrane protein CFEM domain-containing protein n=1 Tax=Coemansia javaensis TaxID=2761396 RepID=A0A9W8HHL8_9FUNG|nr:hypothetical protein H4R18_000654 [Coemansia javaensis]
MIRAGAALALLAATASAQSCTNGEKKCNDNASALLECVSGTWSTNLCNSDMYCMTMNPEMIHCMLKPDGGIDVTDGTGSMTMTMSEGSSDEKPPKSSHTTTDTHSGAQGGITGRGAMAAVGALAAVGLAALF